MVTHLRRPLTLCTLEPVDEVSEATVASQDPMPGAGCQFWFASDYLHHLLAMGTDPSVDNTVEVGIIDRRLALSSSIPPARPARVLRVRTAVVADDTSIEVAFGHVAEQPGWVPRGTGTAGRAGLHPALQPAVQHLVRRRDIEPCLLARSLHWIELRPTLRHGRGVRPGQ